jgi:hypothetical protein
MQTYNAIPVRGLIIRSEPLEKILNGTKTMELRSRANQQRGSIALIRKSSGHIYGVADIGESVGPMDFDDFSSRASEHGVEAHRLQDVFDSGYTTGWKLHNIRRLKAPVAYVHKAGAVIWATLDAAAIAGLKAELAPAS